MTYEVKADPGVTEDLRSLVDEQEHIPGNWQLQADEVDAAIDKAIRLIASLREDPFQGEVMEGRPNARILEGCRRLKFDPREPPPKDRQNRPRLRMRIVWINEPDETAVSSVRVLCVTHRFDSRPYRRAATRLGAVRRSRRGPA